MYRLLIVDDERYIVESLYELFHAQEDMDLDILTACYGDDALELLKQQKIDLILLDIRMPGISGIELAKKIVTDWPLCRIIFLTGYASFDYMYEIREIRNASFLLKTEANASIVAAVKKQIAELEQQRRYQLLSSRTEQMQKHVDYLIHTDILRELLNGQDLDSQRDSIRQKGSMFLFDITRSVYLLYLKVQWNTFSSPPADYHSRIAEITAYMSHHLNERYTVFLTMTANDTLAAFLQPKSLFPDGMQISHTVYIRECLNDCVSSDSVPGCRLLILMKDSEVHWNQIGWNFNFYQQYYAKVVLPSAPNDCCIIHCSETELEHAVQDNYLNDIASAQKYLTQLTQGLRSSNLNELTDALSDLEAIFEHLGSMHHLTAVSLYHKISDIFIESIMQYHLMEKMALQIGLYKLYHLEQFRSWGELFSYYRKLSSVLLQMIDEEEKDSRRRTIEQIRLYIENNLNHTLSLTEIANSVNYNSAYISRLFRQMTGENLFQYILQVRMSKAKEFLTQGNESIQSIAEKLGFDTSQYFSSVFKKYTGISPREYRNQSIDIE